jgi:uncharacterized protein (DUF4415 family)
MSENKRALGSDLNKVDTHIIQPEEYEEIPELSDEWFLNAVEHEGGRPVADEVSTRLRLDADILAAFRATGQGWQTRANAALRDWLKSHPLSSEAFRPDR